MCRSNATHSVDNIAGVDSLLDIVERGLKSRDSAVQTTTGGSVSIAARRWRPSGAEGKHRENERGCQTFGVRSLVFLTAVLPRVSWKYPFGRAFRVVLPAKPAV
jgi:hypothetical protein